MDPLQIKEFLREVTLFSDLSENLLDQLVAAAQFRSLKENEFLLKENSLADYVYIITHGEFIVTKSDYAQNVVAELSKLQRRAVVGEIAFVDDSLRSSSVRCLTSTAGVIALPIEKLKENAPISFYQKLAKKLCHDVRLSNHTFIQKLQDELAHKKQILNLGYLCVYVMLLLSVYDLALKGFVALVNNPATSLFASTSVIALYTIVLSLMVRRMGYSLTKFGVNLHNWKRNTYESLFYTLFFVIFLTLLKVFMMHHEGGAANTKFLDLQAIVPQAPVGSTKFITLLLAGMIVYSIFVFFQEFISRGVIQTCLQDFLQLKYKNLIAIVVTSCVFGSSHIHLSTKMAYAVILPSLFWGWLYLRQKSLVGPIISHIIIGLWFNFVLGIDILLK